jgi:hypothetical protein
MIKAKLLEDPAFLPCQGGKETFYWRQGGQTIAEGRGEIAYCLLEEGGPQFTPLSIGNRKQAIGNSTGP